MRGQQALFRSGRIDILITAIIGTDSATTNDSWSINNLVNTCGQTHEGLVCNHLTLTNRTPP
jgi:hypothetical protein